jgi:flagellar biogenesis protein FliO
VAAALVGNTPAWPDEVSSASLPATLPLRREAAGALTAPSWAAAAATATFLALGGTLLVGRRRKWAWLQARGSTPSSGRQLVRISSQALTPHASLHAVRWNGEELLLACTPQQVTLLARRPEAVPAGEAA